MWYHGAIEGLFHLWWAVLPPYQPGTYRLQGTNNRKPNTIILPDLGGDKHYIHIILYFVLPI